MVTYSNFQKAIIDEINKGEKNVIVNAVAGSGKTFTLIEAVKSLPTTKKVLFLAFNRSIVNELNAKLANFPNCTASTLHAFGYRLLQSFGFNAKNYEVYKDLESQWLNYSDIYTLDTDANVRYQVFNAIKALYDKARTELCPIGDTNKLYDIAEHYDIQCDSDICKVVFAFMKNTLNREPKSNIDFTDMLYLPNFGKFQRNLPKFDYIFVDECQDLNVAQRGLLKILVSANKGCKFVAVGDPKQAINGFAGASCDSFYLLENEADITLPLSVNYRCGKKIIDTVKGIVPQIEACPEQTEGTVKDFKDFNEIKEGDIILCRFNAPLIKVCLNLIKQGKKANIKGNDICKKFEDIVKKYVKTSKMPLMSIIDGLEGEINDINKKLENCDNDTNKSQLQTKIDRLKDLRECFLLLIPKAKTKTELIKLIKSLFIEDYNNKIINLMTIHKSKGLEANSVLILNNEILPYSNKKMSLWQREQEKNLQYVAYTRAKQTLILATSQQVDSACN